MEPEQKAELIFEAAMATFKQRTERMAEIALPFINFVYKEHPEMHDKNIYAPVTDGRHVYQIPVNVKAAYESQGKEVIKCFEKSILLHTIDNAWKENLRDLDELKHSVQNASYEQKDPLLIFKLESVTLFDNMVAKINDQTTSILMRGQIPVQEKEQTKVNVAPDPSRNRPQQKYSESKVDLNDPNQQAAAQHDTRENAKREPVRVEKTVGRNDPCPCGSGKKFKNCHGKNI
jgi:preprotein translocase subunit SecA